MPTEEKPEDEDNKENIHYIYRFFPFVSDRPYAESITTEKRTKLSNERPPDSIHSFIGHRWAPGKIAQ